MEVTADQVRAALNKVPTSRRQPALAFTSRGGTERSVVVERKPSRRVAARPSGRSVG
jgi:hypothetical protein